MVERAIVENAGIGSLESRFAKMGRGVELPGNGEEMTECIKLMRSFLSLDPSARPRAVEALQDPVLEFELL